MFSPKIVAHPTLSDAEFDWIASRTGCIAMRTDEGERFLYRVEPERVANKYLERLRLLREAHQTGDDGPGDAA